MMGSLLLACSGVSGSSLGAPPRERTGCTAEPLEQCASQTVEGIDVFDGQGVIDWSAVAGAGIGFAMIKATQGTYDTQATFASNWPASRRAGVRRGAYHFFDPTEDGVAQAQRFLAAVGPLAAGDLPPMLDLECPDGDPDCLGTGAAGNAPAAVIAGRMWDWIHAVEAATGTRPLVYTFADYFASSGVDPTGLDAYPLFLAQPAAPSGAPRACFTVPSPWSRAAMWQYSWNGAVSGVDGAVDRDRFLGSAADLVAFAALAVATDGSREAGASESDGGWARDAVAAPGSVSAAVPAVGGPPGSIAEGGETDAWPGSPGCY
ncbi:MAG TPA: GH25 family lysozyme [Polyangiaceae bacterium]|nr:GH25 family lysozyme [Polyangiaceae bacterium]